MSAVAKIKDEPKHVATVVEHPRNDLDAILEIARNPEISIERAEQVFSFYERVQASKAKQAYASSFAAMQPKLPIIERHGKGHNDRAYGLWEDIVEKINPILGEHGFSLSFKVAPVPNAVDVTCICTHRDGHSEQTSFPYPYDSSGSKNAIQAIGSATSYGKRYTACTLLNIATKKEDDDGNASSDFTTTITDIQTLELETLISEARADRAKFLEIARAETIGDVLAKDFSALKAKLMLKKKRAS